MENDNNYNLMLDYSDNENSQNIHADLNNNREFNTSHLNKKTIIFMLIASLTFLFLNIFSFYNSYDYLSYHLSNNSNNSHYSECLQNQTITEMFFMFLATLAAISAIILSVGFLYNSELFMEKLFESYSYYNYFIFGPFLLCTSIFGFINYNKIGYSCELVPDDSSINLSMLICLLIILIIGSVITCGYSTISMLHYMNDSIKFKNNSNYLLGKAFWKFASSRNRNRNRRNIFH